MYNNARLIKTFMQTSNIFYKTYLFHNIFLPSKIDILKLSSAINYILIEIKLKCLLRASRQRGILGQYSIILFKPQSYIINNIFMYKNNLLLECNYFRKKNLYTYE